MTITRTILLAAIAGGLALGAAPRPAAAFDVPLAGKKLLLKSGRSQKLVYLYKGPITTVPGSTVDPKTFGATLLVINPGTREAATIELPAEGWSGPDTSDPSKVVRKFKNRGLATPARSAIFKPKKGLKLAVKATGITLDEPAQGSVGLVLSFRSLNYCSVFGGTVKKDQPGKFIAKTAPAPASCPVQTLCGNGVLNGGEECEGTGAGQCAADQSCVSCQCVGVGDVSVQLTWANTNDVDLHVIDPNGEEIYYGHTMSASGGTLDQDDNVGCGAPEDSPVENVYWPTGAAPSGTYTVIVHLYRACDDSPAETPFNVRTIVDGVVTDHPGVVSVADSSCGACQDCGVCPAPVVMFTR